MRTFTVLSMAAVMVLAVAAPVAAGANVGNYSSSISLAEANWESYDESTGTWGYGYLAASYDDGSTEAWIDFGESNETWMLCSDGGTPADESDDTYGVVGTFSTGGGVGSLTIGKRSDSASASGTFDIWTETYDECTGTYDGAVEHGVHVSLDLDATSALVKESGRNGFHLPGEYNNHSSYRSSYRYADGVVAIGDRSFDSYGRIGKVSWSDHSNG